MGSTGYTIVARLNEVSSTNNNLQGDVPNRAEHEGHPGASFDLGRRQGAIPVRVMPCQFHFETFTYRAELPPCQFFKHTFHLMLEFCYAHCLVGFPPCPYPTVRTTNIVNNNKRLVSNLTGDSKVWRVWLSTTFCWHFNYEDPNPAVEMVGKTDIVTEFFVSFSFNVPTFWLSETLKSMNQQT